MSRTDSPLRAFVLMLGVGLVVAAPSAARVEPLAVAPKASAEATDESPEVAPPSTTDPAAQLSPPELQREQLADLVRWTADDAWRGDMPAVLERLEPWVVSMRNNPPDSHLARTYWQRLATAYVALERPLAACESLRHATRLGGGIHGPAGSWASPRMEQVEQQCATAREEEVP